MKDVVLLFRRTGQATRIKARKMYPYGIAFDHYGRQPPKGMYISVGKLVSEGVDHLLVECRLRPE